MPFQKGNSLGKHNNHARGYKCRNLHQLKDMRWMYRGEETQRVPSTEVERMKQEGWIEGRPSPSAETRQKQSEAGKARTDRVRAVPGARRNTQYKVKYKKTLVDFETLYASQGEHCALCPSTGSAKRRLCWDHNHKCCSGWKTCGKCMRGLLCIACNKKIGHLEYFLENGEFIPKDGTWEAAAMAYLASF